MEKVPGVQGSARQGQHQTQRQEDTYDLGHEAVGQQPPQAYLDIAPRPELHGHQAAAPVQPAHAQAVSGLTSYDHDDESEEDRVLGRPGNPSNFPY